MKKSITVILGLLILFSTISVKAQNQFAFFDLEKIFTVMPEATQAQARFEGEQEKITLRFEEMQVEYNVLYQELSDNVEKPDSDPDKWPNSIMDEKQTELVDVQERIQRFQMTAQQDLQDIQVKLFQPVYEKIDSAIAVVVKEKGYPFAFDKNDISYINEDKCEDITSMIKKALGLLE